MKALYKNQEITTKIFSGTGRDTYTSEEQVIGQWIDGKPIYRRVLVTQMPSKAGQVYAPLGNVEGWNIDEMICLDGMVQGASGMDISKASGNIYIDNNIRYSIYIGEEYNIWFNGLIPANGVGQRYIIICEYTKTTDSPVSSIAPSSTNTSGDSIPSGVIVMWSGSSDDIPTGWALCDGENNTPDLRGRFVLGSGPIPTRYVFTSQNHGVASSIASITMTPKKDISSLRIVYEVSTEANYDKFTVNRGADAILDAVSGVVDGSVDISDLTTSDELTFKYAKDGSGDKGDDQVRFWIETPDGKALSEGQYSEFFTIAYPDGFTFDGSIISLTGIPIPGSAGGSENAAVPLLHHTHYISGKLTGSTTAHSLAIRNDNGTAYSSIMIGLTNLEEIPAKEKSEPLIVSAPVGSTMNNQISIMPPYYALCYIMKL